MRYYSVVSDWERYMKIVLIIGLLIVTATLGVLLQEQSQRISLEQFPVKVRKPGENQSKYNTPFILYLYVFFSKDDQPENLEIIGELNNLPTHFEVYGVVPDKQMIEEKKLRDLTGAEFPIFPLSRFKRFTPFYTPSITAVSEKGKIFFVYPLSAGEDLVFKRFLFVFYQNISDQLLKEKKYSFKQDIYH